MVHLGRRVFFMVAIAVLVTRHVAGQDTLDAMFARIYSDYQRLQIRPDVGGLVLLDEELRRILPHYVSDNYVGPNGKRFVEASYLRSGYEDLGLLRASFEPDLLNYSGKMLRDAHRINPRSPYRRYTLYSTLFPRGEDVGEIPALGAARSYLREFPRGPYAADVNLVLAHFQDDLYKLLRDMLKGQEADYKKECYGPYLSSKPYREQLRAARDLGVVYYRRVLALRPKETRAGEDLPQLLNGNSISWFFCPD